MSSEKIREEFEEWFLRTYPLTSRESTQSEILCKMIAEQAWIASREAIEVELPDSHGDDWSGGYAYWADQVHIAIEAAGVKVKP